MFKIQNAKLQEHQEASNSKFQNSKPRTIDTEVGTWEQEGVHNCYRQHEGCPDLSLTEVDT